MDLGDSMNIAFYRCAALAVMVTIPTTTLAWGHQGHGVIGALADRVKNVKLVNGKAKYLPMQRYHAACGAFETPEGIRHMEDFVALNANNCNRNGNTDACHK